MLDRVSIAIILITFSVLPSSLTDLRLSLNVMTLIIESPHIYTKMGVPVSVTGVAQVG